MSNHSSDKQTLSDSQTGTDTSPPEFGWNTYSEKLNGRFAMVGFVALLVMELFTQQDFFTWMGLR
ncbi:MAG: chlorophyll a/b-binding protein [Cyanobacteria bacterium J06632_3]